MKVAILGNGFDLHHELNTSFNHFRDYLLKCSQGVIINEDIEQLLRMDIINELDIFIKKVDEIVTDEDKEIDFETITWADFEAKFQRFVTKYGIQYNFSEFDGIHRIFCQMFEIYLKTLDTNTSPTYRQIREVLVTSDKILVFNYTNTYKKYLSEEEYNNKVIHIHGNLEEEGSLIIGFEERGSHFKFKYDINIGTYNWGSSEYFSKNNLLMRQNRKEIYNLNQELKDLISNVHQIDVLGWSFGNSDNYFGEVIIMLLPKYPKDKFMNHTDVEKLKQYKINIYTREEHKGILIDKFKEKLINGNNYPEIRLPGLALRSFTPFIIEEILYEKDLL